MHVRRLNLVIQTCPVSYDVLARHEGGISYCVDRYCKVLLSDSNILSNKKSKAVPVTGHGGL
jgi:hypothetical protein